MSNSHKPKIIVITGPTASGKTGLSLKLAQKFNGAIISADSRQVYQKMDIATAKASSEEQQAIKHFMLDIVKPDQDFSVGEFQDQTLKIFQKLHQQSILPFLVGGTGLYIKAIVDNLDIPEVMADDKFRSRLEKKPNKTLYNSLKKIDPKACKKICINNKRRIIRALEVYEKTGKPFSSFTSKPSEFNFLQIGLKIDRNKLYKRIDFRVDEMINQGLVEEVKKLRKKYSSTLPSMSGLGYKEIGFYLDKELSLTEAIDLLKQNTRRYAKRQISWFKRDKKINWVKNYAEAEKLITDYTKK